MNKQQQHQTIQVTNSSSSNVRRKSENALKKLKEKNIVKTVKQQKNQGISNCYSNSNYPNQTVVNSNINNQNVIGGITANSLVNQNIQDNIQRKVRANSCVGSLRSSQINQTKKNLIDNENECQSNTKQTVFELYQFIRNNIDKNNDQEFFNYIQSILNEFDTFQDIEDPLYFNQNDLLLNIKQLIEIQFIQQKAAENELKEKHEQECDCYDKNLQRLEAQIRDHIRTQQELKLYLESSQIKCQEQEEQIQNNEKRHTQQTDFLEKVCEQMQQQLEIKDKSIKDMKTQITSLQQEISMLKETLAFKGASNASNNKIQQNFNYYSKQINNLSNQRSQTENCSQRKIIQQTPTNIQGVEIMSQIQIDQSHTEDKENNMTSANQLQVSLYRSQLKQSMRDDVSPEKKIQTIILQQKLQNSSRQQQVIPKQPQITLFNEKDKVIKNQSDIFGKIKQPIQQKDLKERRKEYIIMDNYSSIQSQSSTTDRQHSTIQTIQAQGHSSNQQQIKSNENISQNADYYITGENKQQKTVEPINKFQQKMFQVSKKIKEYIKQQSARDKNSNNKQCLINKLKYFSMKNSRTPSIANQNNLIQYFYEKFEDKLERIPSDNANLKQKVKTLQQINDRRYSIINHKTEECEYEKNQGQQKTNQRHNRSNSFNIGSQQQINCNSQPDQEIQQVEVKFAKKQKSYLPINSSQSSHNNISSSGVVYNNYNLNQLGNLNTNSSHISNFVINNSYTNWNKRRESACNQSGINNISFQLEGTQKIIMNNNYIDESSDSFENFIKDNFILTNNSADNLKSLEL